MTGVLANERRRGGRWTVLVAVLFLSALLLPHVCGAQGTQWDEATVGSEWALYARALAVRGFLPDEPWAIRPFSPQVLDQWQAALGTNHPWADRLHKAKKTAGHFQWLRPSVQFSDNSSFPWGYYDGPVWQGKGVNVWVTVGGTWRRGRVSARFEPLFEYAQNAPFPLEPVAGGGTNPYQDPMEPGAIDLPQRMGPNAYHLIVPGNSYIRYDLWDLGAGFSTENLFWGPGVRNALIFGPNAAGFPHLFFGTNRAIATPFGSFSGQVIYGQLQESAYHPAVSSALRLGAGLVATWQPPHTPLTIGAARFFHRFWPKHWTASDYSLPFGALFSRPQVQGTGVTDNQLASVFFDLRSTSIGLDVYGEFGKNDRNVNYRDLAVEPENNAAWLLGFFKVIGLDSSHTAFWTVRTEVANARVAALDELKRGQSSFYDHGLIVQGHTELGQLLGTPLIQRSGGIDFAVDRYSSVGRLGVALFERQMPPDWHLGMPADQLRSQWDLGFGGVIFHGAMDLNFKVGHVWDLNRFPGQDGGNSYLQLGSRFAAPQLH